MRRTRLALAAMALVGAVSLGLGTTVDAAQGGNGGNGGKPDNPPGKPENPGRPANPGKPDSSGKGKGDLYGDLVIVYRDPSGAPILNESSCIQPLTHSDLTHLDAQQIVDLYGEDAWLIPLIGVIDGEEETACDLVGSDTETPDDDVAVYLEEVDFGRLNLGRAPERVLAQQLDDVTATLTDATIGLDAAGRLTADGVAIDTPGMNLAIHEALQEQGVLLDSDGDPITLPGGYGVFDHAAAAIGAAADKTGQITVDLIVYDNRVLHTPDETELATFEGDGVIGVAGETYLDYAGYAYHRAAMYDGDATGYVLNDDGVPVETSGTIIDLVFGSTDLTATGVVGFGHRADDARAVIEYMHSNPYMQLDAL